MKEPGLDGRRRDKNPPKAGEIQQKRGDTLNRNLPEPIKEFSPNAKLETVRQETGQTSVEKVRDAAVHRGPTTTKSGGTSKFAPVKGQSKTRAEADEKMTAEDWDKFEKDIADAFEQIP